MNSKLSRRDFCRSSITGAMVASALASSTSSSRAVEPFTHSPTSRLRLGLAAYSFRDYFAGSARSPGKPTPSGKPLDILGFIDYCAEHGCDGAELTSYYFPKDFDEAFLLQVKRHAFLRGVSISGSAVGNVFTHPAGPKRDQEIASVIRWIDHAALLGAPHIRIFAGEVPKGLSRDEARKNCIECIEEVGKHAAKRGVFLGVENHGGIVADADGLLAILKAVQNPWIGINLDTGNFHTEDPYTDLERCAPYAVNVQFKAEMRVKGGANVTTDTPRMLQLLRKANYQGFVTLEYESAENPWTAVPRILKTLGAAITS